MSVKQHIRFLTLAVLLSWTTTVLAQRSTMNSVSAHLSYVMNIENAKAEVINNNVVVSLQILALQDVPARQSVILVPELQDTLSERYVSYPVIYINSRNQQIFYEREISRYITDAYAVRKYHDKDLYIDYLRSVPYEPWMETAVLKLRALSCGCNISTPRGDEVLCRLRETKSDVILYPVFRVPTAEAEKVREEKGSAHLRFITNKWDIRPDYMNNPAELKKIYNTIDLVKNDPNVSIRRMTIEGYASPEGNLAHNQFLSENRTNSLRDYISNLGILGNLQIIASGNGENWVDFLEALKNHTYMPQYDKLMDIITSAADYDEKEAMMRRDAPEAFRYCLHNIFPSLRCTKYAVEYTVRPFTLDESEVIFETRPMNLSLNEIYRLAEKYSGNTERYEHIMQKASLLYPSDPYVNLTMAYLAINRKDAASAERYLQNVPDEWPEKRLNASIVSYLQGKLSGHEIYEIQNEYQKNHK